MRGREMKPQSGEGLGAAVASEHDARAAVPWQQGKAAEILGDAAFPAMAGRGTPRLIFAMDATGSRAPSWAAALKVQGEMFSVISETGGLKVQLVHFRGLGEFHATSWAENPKQLGDAMCSVTCKAGATQIGKVLDHAVRTAGREGLSALLYVGDAMEENQQELERLARKLGARGVRAFVFQEGTDAAVEGAFREMAKATGGAFCRLGEGSAEELKALLSAVAAYAAGGREALAMLGRRDGTAQLLLSQLKQE